MDGFDAWTMKAVKVDQNSKAYTHTQMHKCLWTCTKENLSASDCPGSDHHLCCFVFHLFAWFKKYLFRDYWETIHLSFVLCNNTFKVVVSQKRKKKCFVVCYYLFLVNITMWKKLWSSEISIFWAVCICDFGQSTAWKRSKLCPLSCHEVLHGLVVKTSISGTWCTVHNRAQCRISLGGDLASL